MRLLEIGAEDPENTLSLVQTRDFCEYAPLIEELTSELGERFPLSMKNWCGIGERPYPLPFWQVYVLKCGGETVGISGLYRRHEDPPERCWIGWLGVRPGYRRRKIAQRAIGELKRLATRDGFKELWVHTDESNRAAVALYELERFCSVSNVQDLCRGRSSDPRDRVFRLRLPGHVVE